MATTVVNIRTSNYDVYIGRAVPRRKLARSIWANPYVIGVHGDRAEVIARYEQYVRNDAGLLRLLPTLRGKRLGCWCHPEPCHGDVLARLVEELD